MDKKEQKALFFDVDGTLLGSDRKVPPSAREAINEARRRGHLAFINSGRVISMLRPIADQVGMDGILCGCGTEILLAGKRVLYYAMPEKYRSLLIQGRDRYHIDVVLEGSDAVHYADAPSLFPATELVRTMTAEIGALSQAPFDSPYEISKFCIQAGEGSDLDRFFSDFEGDFDIMDRHGGFYECVPKGYSKGIALEKTLSLLRIDPDNAYAFGDSSNDLSMFRSCRHAIAMKDHDRALDPYTEYVTASPEEGGIKKALLHFGII